MRKASPDCLDLSDALAEAVCCYTEKYRKDAIGQVVALLRRMNGGRQIRGTATVLRDGLLVIYDCRLEWLERGKGIGARIELADDALVALRRKYSDEARLDCHVDAICRQILVPKFANGDGPKITVRGGVAYLAEEIEV